MRFLLAKRFGFPSLIVLSLLSACQTTERLSSEERIQISKEAKTLNRTLALEEIETYAGSYISNWSCNCQVFLFTADGPTTLKKYTDNPAFSAKPAKYPLKELELAKKQTKELISQWNILRRHSNVMIDESLNAVSLLVDPDPPGVSKKLYDLRALLHPSVMILYPEDVGMVETAIKKARP